MRIIASYSCSENIKDNHFNCIYCYTNNINGKKYIGQATNFKRRHSKHLKPVGKYIQAIDRAILKYGKENFAVSILAENLQTLCLKNIYESYYIDKFDTMTTKGKGYNIASGGSKGNSYAGKTEREMDLIKEKIRRQATGRKHSEETRTRLKKVALSRGSMKQEVRDKISISTSGEKNHFHGKTHTEETKQKLREINKLNVGEKNPNFGNRGAKNPLSKKIICIDNKTGEKQIYDSQKVASYELSKAHGAKYLPANISSICKCNEDREAYVNKFGRLTLTYKGYTYFYLEDYCLKFNEDEEVLINSYYQMTDYGDAVK